MNVSRGSAYRDIRPTSDADPELRFTGARPLRTQSAVEGFATRRKDVSMPM
jgi:hypothetical protein